MAVGPAIDAIRHGLDRGWSDVGAWSNAVGAALLTSMAVSRRESFHAAVTLAVAGLFLFFIIQAAIHLH